MKNNIKQKICAICRKAKQRISSFVGGQFKRRQKRNKNVMENFIDLITSCKFYVGFILGLLVHVKKLIETIKWYYSILFKQVLVGKIEIYDKDKPKIRVKIKTKENKIAEITDKSIKNYLILNYHEIYGGLLKYELVLNQLKEETGKIQNGDTKEFEYEINDDTITIIKEKYNDQKIIDIKIQTIITPKDFDKPPLILNYSIRKSFNGLKLPWGIISVDKFNTVVNHK